MSAEEAVQSAELRALFVAAEPAAAAPLALLGALALYRTLPGNSHIESIFFIIYYHNIAFTYLSETKSGC